MQEDLEASIARVKERLEKETAAHLEVKQRLGAAEDRLLEMDDKLQVEMKERRKLEALLSEGCLPDDAKVVYFTIYLNHYIIPT